MEQGQKLNPMSIKSFTDIEQSRKLEEILPIESADMWYQYTGISIKDGSKKPIYFPMVIRDCESDEDIPCWSLAALLDILPTKLQIVLAINDFQGDRKEKYFIGSVEHDKYGCYADNPVDACYEMILKLNELKRL